eukprot:7388806-Prymnesium_polylepis.1
MEAIWVGNSFESTASLCHEQRVGGSIHDTAGGLRGDHQCHLLGLGLPAREGGRNDGGRVGRVALLCFVWGRRACWNT